MKSIQSVVVFFLLFSCTKEKETKHEFPRVIMPKIENATEVDSRKMLNVNGRIPLGFNFIKDIKFTNLEDQYDSDSVKAIKVPFDTIIPRKNLKIHIDTTYTIYSQLIEHQFTKRPSNVIINGLIKGKIPTDKDYTNSEKNWNDYFKIISKLKDDNVVCYPLLIYNNSSEDVLMKPEVIQEAKDIDGKWKPIEFTFEYEMCGTGKQLKQLLKQKNYLLFPIIKYKGTFKTKIRAKIRNFNHIYYSNEIDGIVNRSQFNQDFLNEYLESFGDNLSKDLFKQHYKEEMFLMEHL